MGNRGHHNSTWYNLLFSMSAARAWREWRTNAVKNFMKALLRELDALDVDHQGQIRLLYSIHSSLSITSFQFQELQRAGRVGRVQRQNKKCFKFHVFQIS